MSRPIRRMPSLPLAARYIARFWGNISKRGPDECWPWTGANRGGYGYLSIHGVSFRANRLAVLIDSGEDPFPSLICHTCDNPPCCNPAHLFKGTMQDNMDDMAVKGRRGIHCPAGESHGMAKLTAEQICQIKALWASGMYLQREIGAMFGVRQTHISRIVNQQSWGHLP